MRFFQPGQGQYKILSAIALTLLAVWSAWQDSVGVASVAAFALLVGVTLELWGLTWRVAFVITLTLMTLTYFWFATEVRIDAADPLRPHSMKTERAAPAVYFGTIGIGVANPKNIRILSIDREPMVWGRVDDDGLRVSARVFDETGIVARLVDNRLEFSADGYRVSRPTSHTLIVYDRWDKPILRADFVDPNTIVIAGKFRYRDGRTLIITQRGVFREDPTTGDLTPMFGHGVFMHGAMTSAFGFTLGG